MWDTAYYRFCPIGECSYLRKNLYETIKNVMMGIKIDKPKSQVWIGDACPITGQCPGHPAGSHCHLNDIDIDYPVYSGLATQYGSPKEIIWENPGVGLLKNKVDWWMTWQIIIRLKKSCENANPYIHEEIYDLIAENITSSENVYLRSIVNLDQGTLYNHHTHMHIRLDD